MRRFALLLIALAAASGGAAARPDHYFTTSDGVRLHYYEAGPAAGPTLVFIPGWTMPGWIFAPQLAAFSAQERVVAFDPRGQGLSEIAPGGYNQARRGQDIAELLAVLGDKPVVLAGWSLGVLDALAYVHAHGGARLAGLVLIDNSVGEPPAPPPPRPVHGPARSHAASMRGFVAGMFRTPQSAAYLNRLTAAALRTPAPDAALLLRYPVPRGYWRAALLSTSVPVLYVVRPGLAAQANNLLRERPETSIAVFADAGHALFVDDAGRFNALLRHFLSTSVRPGP